MTKVSIKQAAQYTGLSEIKVRAAMRTDGLMWKRIGNQPVTTYEWIHQWLRF
jgi:hypothetical protein